MPMNLFNKRKRLDAVQSPKAELPTVKGRQFDFVKVDNGRLILANERDIQAVSFTTLLIPSALTVRIWQRASTPKQLSGGIMRDG